MVLGGRSLGWNQASIEVLEMRHCPVVELKKTSSPPA